ncbi:hypothetical protein [Gluconobacter morbifer]|uniref:Formate hydrogenlyase subunit 4 n=1 Tax=Gluconobacter morbifer G707 TaxID=1088869 RepID=G6XLC7_9PROT|nr:hypothetical protein [Gluconobacter morbifer]EHH67182.1 hypothetical protein GMO_21750 [Gluconobacter morbifer G707]
MMGQVALAGMESLLQLVFLLVLAPVCGWMLDVLPRWLNGEAVIGPGQRWRQAARFWRLLSVAPLPPSFALCLAALLVVLLALPAVTTGTALISLADPLMMGTLLLSVRPLLGLVTLREEVRRILPALLVLCLTEALVALGAPGADGLGGLAAMLHIEPVPGLEGALVACALALGIACPPLRSGDVTLMMGAVRGRETREAGRVLADVLNCGWVLLLADLALPISIGLAGQGMVGWCAGLGALWGRMLLAVLVLTGLRLTGQERSGRLTALFAGFALLLALAGRFAT